MRKNNMAEILSKDLTVENGQVICVKNTNRPKFSNEDERYYALWVETQTDEEKCLLFTAKEFSRLIIKHIETDIIQFIELGQIYKYKNNYIIKVKNIDQTIHVVQIKQFLYERALRRGIKNIEDQPEKTWFVDFIKEEL